MYQRRHGSQPQTAFTNQPAHTRIRNFRPSTSAREEIYSTSACSASSRIAVTGSIPESAGSYHYPHESGLPPLDVGEGEIYGASPPFLIDWDSGTSPLFLTGRDNSTAPLLNGWDSGTAPLFLTGGDSGTAPPFLTGWDNGTSLLFLIGWVSGTSPPFLTGGDSCTALLFLIGWDSCTALLFLIGWDNGTSLLIPMDRNGDRPPSAKTLTNPKDAIWPNKSLFEI